MDIENQREAAKLKKSLLERHVYVHSNNLTYFITYLLIPRLSS